MCGGSWTSACGGELDLGVRGGTLDCLCQLGGGPVRVAVAPWINTRRHKVKVKPKIKVVVKVKPKTKVVVKVKHDFERTLLRLSPCRPKVTPLRLLCLAQSWRKCPRCSRG